MTMARFSSWFSDPSHILVCNDARTTRSSPVISFPEHPEIIHSTNYMSQRGDLSLLVIVELLSCVQLFFNPMNCSPPGSLVHGISQVGMQEWVAISSTRRSSYLRDWTHVSCWQADFLPLSRLGIHRLMINFLFCDGIGREARKNPNLLTPSEAFIRCVYKATILEHQTKPNKILGPQFSILFLFTHLKK